MAVVPPGPEADQLIASTWQAGKDRKAEMLGLCPKQVKREGECPPPIQTHRHFLEITVFVFGQEKERWSFSITQGGLREGDWLHEISLRWETSETSVK